MLLAKFIPDCYAFHYSPKRGIPLPGFPLGLAWDPTLKISNDDAYYMFRSYDNCYYSSSEPVTDEEDEL